MTIFQPTSDVLAPEVRGDGSRGLAARFPATRSPRLTKSESKAPRKGRRDKAVHSHRFKTSRMLTLTNCSPAIMVKVFSDLLPWRGISPSLRNLPEMRAIRLDPSGFGSLESLRRPVPERTISQMRCHRHQDLNRKGSGLCAGRQRQFHPSNSAGHEKNTCLQFSAHRFVRSRRRSREPKLAPLPGDLT